VITVYYDGKCGLCSREIGYFRTRTPKLPIVFHDIARQPEVLERLGISQADALLYFHVEDEDGQLQSGVRAFALMWGQYRGWRVLAKLVVLPGVRPLVDMIYRKFAHMRFARYPHCKASLALDAQN